MLLSQQRTSVCADRRWIVSCSVVVGGQCISQGTCKNYVRFTRAAVLIVKGDKLAYPTILVGRRIFHQTFLVASMTQRQGKLTCGIDAMVSLSSSSWKPSVTSVIFRNRLTVRLDASFRRSWPTSRGSIIITGPGAARTVCGYLGTSETGRVARFALHPRKTTQADVTVCCVVGCCWWHWLLVLSIFSSSRGAGATEHQNYFLHCLNALKRRTQVKRQNATKFGARFNAFDSFSMQM